MTTLKHRSVCIVGAGAFGLSTALHLLESGYKDVTIFDYQNFGNSQYSPFRGADSASSDTMKVIRSAYGSESNHTTLAMEAIEQWKEWNEEAGKPLFVNCGWNRMHESGKIAPAEHATQETLTASGKGISQYRITDSLERERAVKNGWGQSKLDPFNRLGRGLPVDGVLDTLAGFVYADAACAFALKKVKDLGAKVILGLEAGRFEALIYERGAKSKRAIGIKTRDGQEHHRDLVIIAAGSNTHTLVPSLEKTVNATGANIVHVKIPEKLQEKFKSDVFPVFSWNFTGFDEDGGLSGFPIDDHGTLKFLHRSPRWTNVSPLIFDLQSEVQTSKSLPWSQGTKTNVPKTVVDTIKKFITENIPDLVGCDILIAKICWDSFAIDLDFVIDWVPGIENCLVVAGGSGHGFKFLPTLGKYVVSVLENRSDSFTSMWKWRNPSESDSEKFALSILKPSRRLDHQEMALNSDLGWNNV